jgi:hypothetical protein
MVVFFFRHRVEFKSSNGFEGVLPSRLVTVGLGACCSVNPTMRVVRTSQTTELTTTWITNDFNMINYRR